MDFSSIPRAIESLRRRQPAVDDDVLEVLSEIEASNVSNVSKLLCSPRWEGLAVGLLVSYSLLDDSETQIYMEGPRVPSVTEQEKLELSMDDEQKKELCKNLHGVCLQNLEHSEPRIRTLVAKAVGAYCKISNEYCNEIHDKLTSSIREHLKSGRDENDKYSKTNTGAMDDTTGWRALETNWLCLASLVVALDKYDYEPLLKECYESAVAHVNRHVRAAAMQCLEQYVTHCPDPSILRDTTVEVLKAGLADNWSQVRMAASVLCRVWLQHYTIDDDAMMAILLPRMCLNRFYLAAGVKLYSHDTWRMIFCDGSGIQRMQKQVNAVVRYYVKCCDADNHVVREAACQAIAELVGRIDVQDNVETLLQALKMCFYDESWPVRDEACLACGSLCKAYPESVSIDSLWERFVEQLTDQIWSVRADAAVALGDALEAYGEPLWTRIRDLIAKLLPSALQQPSMTESEYKQHINDPEMHTNTQLYSCGSLAPKLRKNRIGCSSCGIDRPKMPWEATDGCLYLIREVVLRGCAEDPKVTISDEVLVDIWQQMMDVCRVQNFPQSHELRATLWKNVTVMAQALGKERFKRTYLELTLQLLFSNLESSAASALSKHAAGECLDVISNLIGRSIFRGRLDDFQLRTYDQVMAERRNMPEMAGDVLSPFGPPVPLS